MDIYLIRHGETEYNKKKLLQGVTDIPLNDYGIELAKKTAKGLEDVPFDVIYSSPLIRAYRTAEIIRGERPIEIIKTNGLLEISFGTYEGLTYVPERYNIPKPGFSKFFDDPAHYEVPPNGESLEHLRERTTSFIKEIMKREDYQDKTILMSSHGAAIRGILSGLLELPLEQFWNGPVHKNCGVTKLHVENGKWEVVFENRIYY